MYQSLYYTFSLQIFLSITSGAEYGENGSEGYNDCNNASTCKTEYLNSDSFTELSSAIYK